MPGFFLYKKEQFLLSIIDLLNGEMHCFLSKTQSEFFMLQASDSTIFVVIFYTMRS